MIELYLLEQLDAFHRCGTLSAAAEELHLSQPSLSRSMQKLEDTLGVPLFERQKNRLALNSTGILAAEDAGRILSSVAAMEERIRKEAVIKIAFTTLSFSEWEAIVGILTELKSNEGILIASKVADRLNITRSVIVNAMRKFQSAGLIETKSLGMKGTYIKIRNEYLLDEIKKHAKEVSPDIRLDSDFSSDSSYDRDYWNHRRGPKY